MVMWMRRLASRERSDVPVIHDWHPVSAIAWYETSGRGGQMRVVPSGKPEGMNVGGKGPDGDGDGLMIK